MSCELMLYSLGIFSTFFKEPFESVSLEGFWILQHSATTTEATILGSRDNDVIATV